jgi:hypothetical protein
MHSNAAEADSTSVEGSVQISVGSFQNVGDGRFPLPLPKPSIPSPLPEEGGTGWVDGQWYQRLVLKTFYPSPRDDLPPVGPWSSLSRGETWGLSLCFPGCAGVLVWRYGEAHVPPW